jgi:NTE family protein
MKKIGVALSGGGARGFAHIGLLQMLDELGIEIAAISGVSAGGIVGAFYAAGFAPIDILKILKENSYLSIKNILWRKDGFFSLEPLLKILQKNIVNNQFELLQKKLFITATDVQNGNSTVFQSGEVFSAVMASAAIPVIFEPVEINQIKFVDGGLLNNLNAEILKNECDFIIGNHVNKLNQEINLSSKINLLEHCFHLSIAHKVYEQSKFCDIFIEPNLHNFKLFDAEHADEIYEIGYNEAAKFKNELIALKS